MRPYETLTDEQLLAEYAEYHEAAKKVAFGGEIAVIAGEGRRAEYTKSNADALNLALRELAAEMSYRGLTEGGGRSAIPVEIG
jgi:hypothetical protein